jgi:AAHS family 4-hydroxybenzoate transporter-like MFS transporter
MFWIGGLAPLLIAVCLLLALPESVKYLAARPLRRAELLATIRRLRRDLSIANDAQFVIAPGAQASGSGLAQIFGRGLAWITPIRWICFATALMANFFINSWLPLIFESNGFTSKQSGIAISCYHYGGTIGGLLMSLVLGRFGFLAVALMFLVATPAIASIGQPGISSSAMASAAALAGLCTLGAQFGNSAASGLVYPTAFRSRGAGWALAVGRFGSVIGPLIGGTLIGMKIPLRQLFVLASVPMLVGLLASVAVAGLCYKRLGSLHLDDMAEPVAVNPGTKGEDPS